MHINVICKMHFYRVIEEIQGTTLRGMFIFRKRTVKAVLEISQLITPVLTVVLSTLCYWTVKYSTNFPRVSFYLYIMILFHH